MIRLRHHVRAQPLGGFKGVCQRLHTGRVDAIQLLYKGQDIREVNQWTPGCDMDISKELCLVLTLREARKMKLSGKKKEQIVDTLFAGNTEEYEQLCFLVFGEAL